MATVSLLSNALNKEKMITCKNQGKRMFASYNILLQQSFVITVVVLIDVI